MNKTSTDKKKKGIVTNSSVYNDVHLDRINKSDCIYKMVYLYSIK